MKKYIPKPGIPKPTPKPGDSKGEGTVKPPRYVGKPVPVPSPTPKPKPDKKKNQKRGKGLPGDQYVPIPAKPTPNRLRFLEEVERMNKRTR